VPGGAAQEPRAAWREAPEYVRLFAPRARREAYRAAVSPASLDLVLSLLAADSTLLRPPGAWLPRAVTPSDAFGQAAAYPRWKLARLYGAQQARVARGPRQADGRLAESWTLVSPYPDPQLERLEPGTLLIVLRLP
jgi:hypothetical protein